MKNDNIEQYDKSKEEPDKPEAIKLRNSNYNKLLKMVDKDNVVTEVFNSIIKDATENPNYDNRHKAREMLLKYIMPNIEIEEAEEDTDDNREIRLQINVLNNLSREYDAERR